MGEKGKRLVEHVAPRGQVAKRDAERKKLFKPLRPEPVNKPKKDAAADA